MKMLWGSNSLSLSTAVLLQIWILAFATPNSCVVQSKNLKGHWALEEGFTISLFSFLPTAALSKDHSTFVNKKCVEDSRLVEKALLNRTAWALSSI